MKSFKIILFITGIVYLVWGCSSEKKSETGGTKDTATVATKDTKPYSEMTDDEKIEKLINDAMTLVRFHDKSYLYDMEFPYYKDAHTFDDYLSERRIAFARADTLDYVKVVSAEYFGQDSALADLELHFKGPTGIESVIKQPGTPFYKRDGKWYKPTISRLEEQLQYEEIQEQARKSAKSETGK